MRAALLVFAGLGLLPLAVQAGPAAPQLRVGLEATYPPLIEAQHGHPRGISVDILALVAADQHLDLRYTEPEALPKLLAMARAGQVDVLTSLAETASRSEFLQFTTPYLSLPAVVVLLRDDPGHDTLESLEGAQVAVGEGYAVQSFLERNYPRMRLHPVGNDQLALDALAEHNTDAAVMDIGSARWLFSRPENWQSRHFRIGSGVGFDYQLSFAVPKGRMDLIAHIEEGMRAIRPEQRQEIVDRHLGAGGSTSTGLSLQALGLLAPLLFLYALALVVRRRRAGQPPSPSTEPRS